MEGAFVEEEQADSKQEQRKAFFEYIMLFHPFFHSRQASLSDDGIAVFPANPKCLGLSDAMPADLAYG